MILTLALVAIIALVLVAYIVIGARLVYRICPPERETEQDRGWPADGS